MPRYIDVDVFESAILKEYDKAVGVEHNTLKMVFEILSAQPTTDVQPVVRGEWIPVKEPDADYNQEYECSKCHKHDVHAISQEVPYCWYCGARMVEK